MNKPFSQALHDKHDGQAKKKFIDRFNFLYAPELMVEENDDPYGIDLRVKGKSEYVGFIEVEQKDCWKSFEFPWPNLQIPSRKRKNHGTIVPVLHIVFNSDFTNAVATDYETIVNSPERIVPNKLQKEEYYFIVPLGKVTIGYDQIFDYCYKKLLKIPPDQDNTQTICNLNAIGNNVQNPSFGDLRSPESL